MARDASPQEYQDLLKAGMGTSDGANVAGVADFSSTAGDRVAQADIFNAFKTNVNSPTITGDQFMEQMVQTEYAALNAADRTWVNAVAAMETIEIANGSEVRTGILAVFSGTQTLTNLTTAFQDAQSTWEFLAANFGGGGTPGDGSDPLDPRRDVKPVDIDDAWGTS